MESSLTLVIVLGGAYFYATTGHFDIRAVGNTPSIFERRTANKSVDAWVDANAPKQENPFKADYMTSSWMAP